MDFSKLDGLIPAVIQDDETNEVLMVGFMNDVALAKTRESGFATFFSRTRNKLWMKGETRGTSWRSNGSSSTATTTRCSCGSSGWATATCATPASARVSTRIWTKDQRPRTNDQ